MLELKRAGREFEEGEGGGVGRRGKYAELNLYCPFSLGNTFRGYSTSFIFIIQRIGKVFEEMILWKASILFAAVLET